MEFISSPAKKYVNSEATFKVKLPDYETRRVEGTFLDEEGTKQDGKTLIAYKGNTSQEGTPTPDNPIDVNVVTGENKVVVSNQNLFDSSNSLNTGTYAGITITKNNDGTYDYEGTATAGTINIWLLGAYSNYSNFTNWDSFDKSKIILRLGAGTYTFTDIRAYFVFEDDSKLSTGNVLINTSTTITFTQTAYCVAIGTPHPPQQGVYYSGKLYPQLEKGSTATDYIQHQEQSFPISLGSLELCKIGDYQDYIYRQNGTWYLHKEILKLTYDGTETGWSKSSNTTVDRFLQSNSGKGLKTGRNEGYNNYFIVYERSTLTNIGYMYTNGNQFIFNFSEPGTTTLDDFKTWLSTHNLIQYAILEEATDTEITNQALIDQLEYIKNNLKTYEEETIISQVNSDLPFYLDVLMEI